MNDERRMKRVRELTLALLGVVFCVAVHSPAADAAASAAAGKRTATKSSHHLPQKNQQVLRFSKKDGGEGTVFFPKGVHPLQPFSCQIQDAGPGKYELADPDHPGSRRTFTKEGILTNLVGIASDRKLSLLRDGKIVAALPMTVVAQTVWQADRFNSLFKALGRQARGHRSVWKREGRTIVANPTWLRDHIHKMKGYQYWQKDISSFVDEVIRLQRPDGFYFEILARPGFSHQWYVDPDCFLREDDKNLVWIRLEMEADIEYLVVEAAHRIWQATGDDKAMKQRLPSLERALEYNFTDPTRWNAKHGALMRTFSIDTWDFTYGMSTHNRRIRPDFPMGIMHGDNSGLYRACLQLSDMLTAAGNTDRAKFWRKRGEELRERINKLCFNGNYYTHQILLQPVDTGVKEEEILSLSNTYDINRGLPTHDMAVKIIDEYQRRRAALRETHFAEWFSIHPPYPKFALYKAGSYINGSICGFVAGELSKAAFHHGREEYAADILDRVDQLVKRDGAIGFMYNAAGKRAGGGPAGWSASAVISAMVEGLAGIRDDATLFQTVTVAPRFAAAGINDAYVCLKYAPSGAWVAMDYRREGNSIALRLGGNPDLYHVKILLPKGVKNAKVADAATGAESTGIETVEDSRYFTLDIPAAKRKEEGVACRIEWK